GAALTIAADGRDSRLRAQSGLPLRVIGAPIDVLWFSLPRVTGGDRHTLLNAGPSSVVISIDRGDYWQCAYVIEKDGLAARRALGPERVRGAVGATAPHLRDAVAGLASWNQV